MSRRILRRAALSGSLASLTSTSTLLVAGIHDCGSAFAPVNAVSHWIWHERALRQDSRSLRYSAVGYLIHHAASLFWAVGFETIAACAGSPETRGRALARAAGVSSLACAVDLCCIPAAPDARFRAPAEQGFARGRLCVLRSRSGVACAAAR